MQSDRLYVDGRMFVWNKRAEKVLIDNKNKTQLPLALWGDVDVNHVPVAIAFAIVIAIVCKNQIVVKNLRIVAQ